MADLNNINLPSFSISSFSLSLVWCDTFDMGAPFIECTNKQQSVTHCLWCDDGKTSDIYTIMTVQYENNCIRQGNFTNEWKDFKGGPSVVTDTCSGRQSIVTCVEAQQIGQRFQDNS